MRRLTVPERTARDPAGRGATPPAVEPLAQSSPVKRLIPISAALALAAVAIRVHNALHYPADWGFDASFNWRYIYRLTQDWALPPPEAGWSTSDPPLFYYASAAVMRCLAALGARDAAVYVLPLLSALEGLGIVALAVALARRAAPADPLRVALAGLLLLFLPAHLHMSAMVNEEMLAALLTSCAVFGLAVRERGRAAAARPGRRDRARQRARPAHQAERRDRGGDGGADVRRGRLEAGWPRAGRPARRRGSDRRAAGRRLVPGAESARDRLAPADRPARARGHAHAAARRARAGRLPARAPRHLSRPPAPESGSAALGLGQHLRHGLVRRASLLPAARRAGP